MWWFSKKRNVAVAVIVAVMVLGAIFGVVWGVTHHTEGNRLEVCWVNGTAYYNPDQVEQHESVRVGIDGCEETEEIIWQKSQIPIAVQVVASSGELSINEDDIQIAKSVIRDYNAQVGFEFYRLSKEGRGDLWFHPRAAYETGSSNNVRNSSSVPGWATHSKTSDGRVQCDVHVRGGLSNRYTYRVAFHEFGHCGGLAHDPNDPSSIMYPFSDDDTDSRFMLQTRLTDNDVSLHQIYR